MTSTRDRLLNAARTILAEQGLAGLSVRHVAAAAGLSPMAMYRHFADKDALVDALMYDGRETWEKIVSQVRSRDPIRWIERACEAFVEFAIIDPHRFEAAILLPARSARQYPGAIDTPSPGLALMIAKLKEAEAKGVQFQIPTERILPMLSALLVGMVSLYRSGRVSNAADLRKLSKLAVADLLRLARAGDT